MYVSLHLRYSIEIRRTASPNPYYPDRDVQLMSRTNTKDYLGLSHIMPRGLKQSSSVVSIGFSVSESAANTFTQGSVDLNLSPLDREVFVVLACNLDPESPDMVAPLSSFVNCSLTTTSQTAVQSLANSNCISVANERIIADAVMAVGFQTQALETPPSTLEYIGIIATNDFFIQVGGFNNLGAKGVSGKIYGYRAIADASIYAALVQSEVLSA
jgi:hypothetical protein